MKITRIGRRTPPGTAPGTLTADPHGLLPTVHVSTVALVFILYFRYKGWLKKQRLS